MKNIIIIFNCQIYTIYFLYRNFNRLWIEDYREMIYLINAITIYFISLTKNVLYHCLIILKWKSSPQLENNELLFHFVDANDILLRLRGQHDGFAPENKAKTGVVNLEIE